MSPKHLLKNYNTFHALYQQAKEVQAKSDKPLANICTDLILQDNTIDKNQLFYMLRLTQGDEAWESYICFSYGEAMARKSEAVQYQKMALMAKVRHAIKEQKMNDRLARKRLHAVQTQIASARSALHAARSSYETVKKKYEAGVVDNVTYLDALSQRTMAQARYEATRYDYEIAKAVYYFYAGQALTRTIR